MLESRLESISSKYVDCAHFSSIDVRMLFLCDARRCAIKRRPHLVLVGSCCHDLSDVRLPTSKIESTMSS
jgi:hypothetical protein